MKYVMPIEDRKMVGVIGDYLRERNERDYVLFMTGVYLGRRISDILQYRVRDLRGKDRIAIAEQKTGETILLPINPHLQKFLQGKEGLRIRLPQQQEQAEHADFQNTGMADIERGGGRGWL